MMESRKPASLKRLSYIGPSMNPIFKGGDRLEILSSLGAKIRAGDVVVFVSPKDGSKVVHRVVSVNADGIRTRGDNCTREDDWLLSREDIIGRVVSARRGKRRIRVFGGLLGDSLAVVIRVFKSMETNLTPLLRPFYQLLARSGALRRWLPTEIMKRKVIFFDRAEGVELQLLMGRRVIGRWLPGKRRWHIRRPFRLFVDERSLPENPGKESVVGGQLSVANKAK